MYPTLYYILYILHWLSCRELLPALPSTGLFAVDALLKKHPSVALHEEEVTWQWKDDKGCWKSYGAMDSRIIEVQLT